MMQNVLNRLSKVYGFEIIGQWHLKQLCNDDDDFIIFIALQDRFKTAVQRTSYYNQYLNLKQTSEQTVDDYANVTDNKET